MTARPKIYVFSNVVGGGDGIALAMAEDGTVLGSHWCSCEAYAPGDLGVTPASRPDRHKTYAEHYPDGYEMEFVRASEVKSHPGLTAACVLNKTAGEAAKATLGAEGSGAGDSGTNPNPPLTTAPEAGQ